MKKDKREIIGFSMNKNGGMTAVYAPTMDTKTALKKAINALNQVPSFKLNDPDFKSSYELLAALERVTA